MLLIHACLMPLVVGFLVVWHVLLVRRRGVVPPLDAVSNEVPDLVKPTKDARP